MNHKRYYFKRNPNRSTVGRDGYEEDFGFNTFGGNGLRTDCLRQGDGKRGNIL